MLTKKQVRALIKEQFSKQSLNQLRKISNTVCKKILNSEEYNKADFIFVYNCLKDELDLSLVIKDSIKNNKIICFPKILTESLEMEFYYLKELNNKLSLETVFFNGYNNILEPDNNQTWNKVDDSFLQNKNVLVLVPGRAFTKDGIRLGRGKGFYDKYLLQLKNQNCKELFICGVCFNFQLMNNLPYEKHDIKMDKVFS